MTYIRLLLAGLIPVIFCIIFLMLDKKTKFHNLSGRNRQIIIGVIFGCLAVIGTEFGITIDGYTMNARDAAPLLSGLIFGPWAGIIAGLIGGIERYFAVLWGAGMYTRIACCLATILSGLFGAFLKISLFKDSRPKWYYGLASGLIAETLHMLMVFLTNISDAHNAFKVVSACSIPMISVNAIAVGLGCLVIGLIEKEPKRNKFSLTSIFEKTLAIMIVIAFIASTVFISTIQKELVQSDTYETMKLNIDDVVSEIKTKSNKAMLDITQNLARDIELTYVVPSSEYLISLAEKYDVCEVDYINTAGIVYSSTDEANIGFVMSSGEQSKEFMCLLMGEQTYVQDYQATAHDEGVYRKYAGVRLKVGGFVQIGYDWDDVEKSLAANVANSADNRRIGKEGFIIIADTNGNIVSDRMGYIGQNIKDLGITDVVSRVNDEFLSRTTVSGMEMLTLYRVAEGYYIISLIPVSEANFTKNITTNLTIFLEIIIYGCLFIMIFLLIRDFVIKRIHKLNKGLNKISAGDLSIMMNENKVSEFIDLSNDINQTVGMLKTLIDEAKERVRKELEFANIIQEGALPKTFPPKEGETRFDVYASMDPAKEVGGDFYDFYYIDDDHFAFMVSDVSGKGIPAAMFMMTSKTLLKNLAMSKLPINDIYMKANKELCLNNEADMFVTSWMGICDLRTGVIKFTNAGHNPPLVKRKNGQFEYIKSKVNFVLAGMSNARYMENEIILEPGDELYLYTDGVTEATSKDVELYGEARLKNILNKKEYITSKDVLAAVKKDVDKFAEGNEQFDDITMLSFKYKG